MAHFAPTSVVFINTHTDCQAQLHSADSNTDITHVKDRRTTHKQPNDAFYVTKKRTVLKVFKGQKKQE